jgi:hypothetical protein
MNFEDVRNLAKRYGVEVEQKGSDICYARSCGNTWYFYLRDLPRNINDRCEIYLYHKCHSKEKEHYHTQRRYSMLEHLLDSVSSHDVHMFKERKKSRKELLFEMIENERKKKDQANKKSKPKQSNRHNNLNKNSKFVS